MLDPTRRLQSDVHPLMTPNLHHLWKTRSRKSKTLNFHPYMTSPDATENGWDCSSPYIADRGTPKTGLRPAYITSPKRNELELPPSRSRPRLRSNVIHSASFHYARAVPTQPRLEGDAF